MLAILRRQRGPISSFVACIQHADHQLTNPISLRDFNLTPPIAASHNDKNTIIRQATTAACPSTASTTSSNAILLDGRAVSAAWQDELAAEVARIRAAAGRPPGIGIVLVGERPDSQLYVARKTEACERVGMYSDVRHLPSSVSQRDLRSTVQKLCSDPLIDGILVQLPLPRHIDEEDIIESFDPAKDVDGFHPLNVGRTLMRGRSARFVPCTALGCMELLQRSHIQVKDASVVIVGDSNIVGMPLAMLFRDAGAATVTVVHRSSYSGLFGITPEGYRDTAEQRAIAEACLPRTPGPRPATSSSSSSSRQPYEVSYLSNQRHPEKKGKPPASPSSSFKRINLNDNAEPPPHLLELSGITRTADILVVAVGYPRLIKRDWIKPGAVVLDVGINVVDGLEAGAVPESPDQGQFHVVGDVDFEQAVSVASAITPVPGGVGPMTIAAVLHNTMLAAKSALKLDS